MTQTPTKHRRLAADFQAATAAAPGPAWLRDLRENAWASFNSLGFPTARRGNEKWKYTNVAPIANAAFGFAPGLTPELDRDAVLPPQALWEESWTNLVFVDGRFSRRLSTPHLDNGEHTAGSIAQAVSSSSPGVERGLSRRQDFLDDGFLALNTAFLDDGAFVEVPDGCELESPVHLLFITTGREQPRASYPRTLVLAGPNSKLSVVETYLGPPDSQYFTNAVTEIVAADGAAVDHYRVLLEGSQAFHVGTSRVYQGRDSVFDSTSLSLGTALARNDFQVTMEEPGGACGLNGLYMTLDGQHMDNLIGIDHARPHTSSRLNYKGVLHGKSKAVFGGEVLVRRDAQKVVAQQSDANLLLSDQAEVDSKPSLLIYADDVNCGHGATAGHLDDGAMFYLASRGLDPDTAGRMLVQAFARDIIDTVKLAPLREHLDGLFLNSLPTLGVQVGGGS